MLIVEPIIQIVNFIIMKSNIFKRVVVGALMFSGALFLNTSNADADQLITIGGDADRIICHCTVFGSCKASGGSGVCAQSAEGGNIRCTNWNSNC